MLLAQNLNFNQIHKKTYFNTKHEIYKIHIWKEIQWFFFELESKSKVFEENFFLS